MNPDPDLLRAIPLFGGLSDDQRTTVASWLEVREESAGRRLVPEGAAGYAFFVIAEGSADVVHEGQVVASLGPGDFFGEMALIGDGRRTADVVATSPITLYDMFGTSFRQLEMGMPDVAAQIHQAFEERRSAL